MITKASTMKGLIVSDWLDRQGEFEKEVGGYFRAGKLKNKETVVSGARNRPGGGRVHRSFRRKNIGKIVVELT